MPADRRIFLSTVTSEFKSLRGKLDATLRPAGFNPEFQEIFPNTDSDTVRMLADKIQHDAMVVHIVGHQPGAVANPRAVADLLRNIPADTLLANQPELRAALGDLSGITYTQWEALLALHFGIPLLVFVPADAMQANKVSPSFAQKDHLSRLLLARKHPVPCDGELDFLTKIPAAIYRHFGVSAPAEKPRLLPYPTLGKLFKGREDFMVQLRAELAQHTPTVIRGAQAIHGLGGVGKTRAAVEYAYANEHHYSALLFVTADTPETLQRNLAGLCGPLVLDLPEQSVKETDAQVHAAIHWLRQHPDWFLIIDNVDSPESKQVVLALLQQIGAHGHVLITSRLEHWPTGFSALALNVLDEANSIRLLLDHTEGKRHATPEDEALAGKIARELGGLCLALEQAAAYIRQNGCGFAQYLAAWEKSSVLLHQQYSDRGIDDYHAEMSVPRSLVVTYETSLSQLTAPARELFLILSWLAPEPLPLKHLDAFEGVDARSGLNELKDFHLATLNPQDQTFSVHRLLQEISRQQQPEPQPPALLTALEWINGEMPDDTDNVQTWPVAGPLMPHVVDVANFASLRDIPEPSARLLLQAALLFRTKANFLEAEELCCRSIEIRFKHLGANHPALAIGLNNLAQVLQATGQLDKAESLMERALAIDQAEYGPQHPNVAMRLCNLGLLLMVKNRLADSEKLLRRAVEINISCFGMHHPSVTRDLKNLASLLKLTNRTTEAEPLMRMVLSRDEAEFGSAHPNVALDLNNLAQLLVATARLKEAEPLMTRALEIDESSFGPTHPKVAVRLNNFAGLLLSTHRFSEAEPLMRRALAIDQASYGQDHPAVARDLNNLAQLLQATNRLTEAEPLMRRALAIDEASYGQDHPKVAIHLNNLGRLLQDTNRLTEAEPLMRRAVKIWEASFGLEHPNSVGGRKNLEALLKKMQ